jgi:hypothetical protein
MGGRCSCARHREGTWSLRRSSYGVEQMPPLLDGATMRRRRVLHEARVMRSLATFSRPLQHAALSHKRVARLKHRLVAVAAVACK